MSQEELFKVFNKAYAFIQTHSIHDIRNLAREFGVKSPTSSKKDAIAEELILLAAGIATPKERSTKGAKAKSGKVSEAMLLEFKALIREGIMLYSYDNVQKLEPAILQFQDSGSACTQLSEQKQLTSMVVLGVVDSVNGQWYLRNMDYLRREDDCLIPQYLIQKFSLKKGDILECRVCIDGQKILQEVRTINGRLPFLHYRNSVDFDTDSSNFMPTRFDFNQSVNPLLKAIYALLPFSKGSQVAISKQPLKNNNIFLQILQFLQGTVFSFVLFIFQEKNFEEELIIKSNFPFVTVISYKNLTPKEMFDAIYLVVEQRKRAIEFGSDVIFLIDDLYAMYHFFQAVEKEEMAVASTEKNKKFIAIEEAKFFLNHAKLFKNVGSLTIGILFEENATNLALIHELMPKCDAHLFFQEVHNRYLPDFKKSYTLHFKELLSKEEQLLANKLKSFTAEELLNYFSQENL